MTQRLPILVLAVSLAFACSKTSKTPASPATAAGQKAPAGATAQPAAAKPVPAQLPEVVARVNGDAVARSDFERAVKALEAQAGGPVPPERRDAVYRQVLDQLVAFKLLTQEARARNISVPETDIDGKIGEIRKQFPNEQEFTSALAQRQMTPDGLKTDIRHQLMAMKLVDSDVKPSVKVGDKEVADFYQKNPDKFQEPEAMHAAHILIRFPQNADDAAKLKAHADAVKVLAEVKKKGADFAALAKKYSQDPASAVNGGDLGFVAKGQGLPPAFEAAVFALQPGQLSGVVESPFGYHIIKAIEHRAARTVPLDEVKTQVTEFLTQQQMQEKTNAFIEKLKSKAKVEILI